MDSYREEIRVSFIPEHCQELAKRMRFEFGRNWAGFIKILNVERITQAEKSLITLLEADNLKGKLFLDIGSGSGLFSLAARRMGAKVRSFDYDSLSVACARELKRRYCADDPEWIIEEGSILNEEFVKSLGRFDVVYSWGVLHHTGDMWQALFNSASLVKPEKGILAIAIYNHHWTSIIWKQIKKLYNLSPHLIRWCLNYFFCVFFYVLGWLKMRKNPLEKERGMDFWHDVIDWLGGYPYEYAKIEDVINFVEALGFRIKHVIRSKGWTGCNEFLFERSKERV
jgi:2-polyprenyl-6-hydroxyphenyl methylase/3-demethylubiquinone-9 3-methyltransferase